MDRVLMDVKEVMIYVNGGIEWKDCNYDCDYGDTISECVITMMIIFEWLYVIDVGRVLTYKDN